MHLTFLALNLNQRVKILKATYKFAVNDQKRFVHQTETIILRAKILKKKTKKNMVSERLSGNSLILINVIALQLACLSMQWAIICTIHG